MRSKAKKKENILNQKNILAIYILGILAVFFFIILYVSFIPNKDELFPRITWCEPIEIKTVVEAGLAKDIQQIMVNYNKELEMAIDQKSKSLCDLAFQNFYLRMIELAQKNGWQEYVQQLNEGKPEEFYNFLLTKLEESGWHFSVRTKLWGFDWGAFKVENCRLGQIIKIQSGKIGLVDFQLITLKSWETVCPESLSASTGYGRIILLQNILEAEYNNQTVERDLNKYIYYVTTHELQHVYDKKTYSVSESDSPILEVRAALRTLIDNNIKPELVFLDIKHWSDTTHTSHYEASRLLFMYLGNDIGNQSTKQIRARARNAFYKTTRIMKSLKN